MLANVGSALKLGPTNFSLKNLMVHGSWHPFVLRSFNNACIRSELEDLVYVGRSTCSLDLLLETRYWIVNFDFSRTHLLQVICKIPIQLQAECHAYLDHKHLFQSLGCARKQTVVSHSGAESERKEYSHCNCGGVFWNFSRTRPNGRRHSLSHFTDHVSFDSIGHVPSNVPQSSLPARHYIFEDSEAVIRIFTNVRNS